MKGIVSGLMVLFTLSLSLFAFNEAIYHRHIGLDGISKNYYMVAGFFALISMFFVSVFAGNINKGKA